MDKRKQFLRAAFTAACGGEPVSARWGRGRELGWKFPFASLMEYLRQNNFAMKRGLLGTQLGALLVLNSRMQALEKAEVPWRHHLMVGSHDRACVQRKGRPGKSSGTWLIFITLGSCGKSEASQFLIATRGSSSHALETSLCAPPLCNHTGPHASKKRCN